MVLRVVQIYRGETGEQWYSGGQHRVIFFVFIDIRRQRLGFVAKKDYVFNQSRDWLFLRGCADNSENGE